MENTYPIKALSGAWKPAIKGWIVPDERAEFELVEEAGVWHVNRGSGRRCKMCRKKIDFGAYCDKCDFA